MKSKRRDAVVDFSGFDMFDKNFQNQAARRWTAAQREAERSEDGKLLPKPREVRRISTKGSEMGGGEFQIFVTDLEDAKPSAPAQPASQGQHLLVPGKKKPSPRILPPRPSTFSRNQQLITVEPLVEPLTLSTAQSVATVVAAVESATTVPEEGTTEAAREALIEAVATPVAEPEKTN